MTSSPFDPRLTPARADLAASTLRGRVAAGRFVDGQRFRVADEIADLRRAPSRDAPLDTQALHGEVVTLYEENEGWAWVQLAHDGYVGYLAFEALAAPAETEPTHRLCVNRSFVYPGPDLKQPPVAALPLGAVVGVVGEANAFARLATGGFVFGAHLAPIGAKQADFVDTAEGLTGTAYLWGGKTGLGIDCSGLVQLALAQAGIEAPRDTDLQENAIGDPIEIGDDLAGFRRGDLVFWKGHVGIMRDAAMLIHANAHHMLVASEPVLTARDRIAARAGGPITSVRRL